MNTEERIKETVKEQSPIDQNEIVDEVFDVDRCSECGEIGDIEEWGVKKSKVHSVLRGLMYKDKISYTKDWKIIWEG